MVFVHCLKIASKRGQRSLLQLLIMSNFNVHCVKTVKKIAVEHKQFQVPCLKNATKKDSKKSVKQRFLARLLWLISRHNNYGQAQIFEEAESLPEFKSE